EEIKRTLRERHPDLSHVTVEVAVCADCSPAKLEENREGKYMTTAAAFATGIVLGDAGKLRPLWRAITFAVLADWAAFPLLQALVFLFIPAPKYWLAPGPVALNEILNFVTALICTAGFALY